MAAKATPITSTKYSYLDANAREEYRKRWYYLKNMVEKWHDPVVVRPGDVIPIFGNRRNLEREIIDLEDISLSAYRAMKCLKALLKDAVERDDEYITPTPTKKPAKFFCANCSRELTDSQAWLQLYGKYFCDTGCSDEYEQDYEHGSYAG